MEQLLAAIVKMFPTINTYLMAGALVLQECWDF